MAKRQRAWAEKWTGKLRRALGGKCAECGSKANLEFDVVVPVDSGEHHRIEWSWRISFYRRQHAEGNLNLLCSACNGRKGDRPGKIDPALNFSHAGPF